MYEDEVDVYKDALSHEFSHLRSVACKHRIKKGQKFNEILGSDFATAILESSAESSIYAMNEYGYHDVNSLDFTYSDERKEESLILMLGLFCEDKTYEDYYNAIVDSNPEAFYDFVE